MGGARADSEGRFSPDARYARPLRCCASLYTRRRRLPRARLNLLDRYRDRAPRDEMFLHLSMHLAMHSPAYFCPGIPDIPISEPWKHYNVSYIHSKRRWIWHRRSSGRSQMPETARNEAVTILDAAQMPVTIRPDARRSMPEEAFCTY
jgi:hypothetical protein